MKFLCLHGAYGSAATFKVQMAPFTAVVEKAGNIGFKWIDGAASITPPPGYENYFGQAPNYRHIDSDGIKELDDIVANLAEFTQESSPEESIRAMTSQRPTPKASAVTATVDRLLRIIEEDPEIEGIFGYSEGAMVAATLLLEERRRFERQGRPRRVKCGVFFCGWPPISIDNDETKPLLADETEERIDVPSCHVVGCDDPFIDAAMALFSVCDEDSAALFDHAGGHLIPRDIRTLEELASEIRGTIERAEQLDW